MEADLVVTSPLRKPILIVEVKRRIGVSKSWAASMRANLYLHSPFQSFQFFLLATSEQFFLWRGRDSSAENVMPDYACAAEDVLGSSLGNVKLKAAELSPNGLELAVGNWLESLVRSPKRFKPQSDEARELVVESGLLDALAGGSVAYEAHV